MRSETSDRNCARFDVYVVTAFYQFLLGFQEGTEAITFLGWIAEVNVICVKLQPFGFTWARGTVWLVEQGTKLVFFHHALKSVCTKDDATLLAQEGPCRTQSLRILQSPMTERTLLINSPIV